MLKMLVIGNLNEKKYEIIMKDKPINEIKKNDGECSGKR